MIPKSGGWKLFCGKRQEDTRLFLFSDTDDIQAAFIHFEKVTCRPCDFRPKREILLSKQRFCTRKGKGEEQFFKVTMQDQTSMTSFSFVSFV